MTVVYLPLVTRAMYVDPSVVVGSITMSGLVAVTGHLSGWLPGPDLFRGCQLLVGRAGS